MLRTRVTEVLGIDVPIVLAPMGRWAEPTLATAVSQAGALGSIGAWPHLGMDVPEVKQCIGRIRQQTSRPFAAGFLNFQLEEHRSHLDAVLEEGVPIVLLSFGDPAPWIPVIHEGGAKVVCQIQDFELARSAVEAGADILCVQGNEAGGHTGRENLLPFLIQVLEAFPETPTIVSGGISSGRALAAVLAAGAEGAWVGTALVASKEAEFTTPELRQTILKSDGRDTIRSNVMDIVRCYALGRPPWPFGVALRHRRTEVTDRWDGHEDELSRDIPEMDALAERVANNDNALVPLIYGEGAGSISELKTAKDTIDLLISDALAWLRRARKQWQNR